jgi:hypothetical protein
MDEGLRGRTAASSANGFAAPAPSAGISSSCCRRWRLHTSCIRCSTCGPAASRPLRRRVGASPAQVLSRRRCGQGWAQPVPAQMWQGWAQSVPAQMWAGVGPVGPGADVGRGGPSRSRRSTSSGDSRLFGFAIFETSSRLMYLRAQPHYIIHIIYCRLHIIYCILRIDVHRLRAQPGMRARARASDARYR